MRKPFWQLEVLIQESPDSMSDRDNQPPILIDAADVSRRLALATADLATALGLVRVLTLLPLYDASLGEMEELLASSCEQLWAARQLVEDGTRTSRHLHLVRDPDEMP